MTDLADAAAVRRWAMRQGRNMSVSTLRAFRNETLCGISRAALIEILSGTRMKPSPLDLEVLPTRPTTDASLRAETLVYVWGLIETAATQDDLSLLAREVNRLLPLLNVDRIHAPWMRTIRRFEDLADAALSIAGEAATGADTDVAGLTYDQALATRDRRTIAQWGAGAREAALFSHLDLLQARGLEDVVEDALVRAAHLV